MTVFVTESRDISQPMAKLEDKSEETNEENNENDSSESQTFSSSYLKRNAGYSETPSWYKSTSTSRMTKFTCFDGLNEYEALEYERLEMIKSFEHQLAQWTANDMKDESSKDEKTSGLILHLIPPI